MKVKEYLKDLLSLVSNVRQLEKDVENLETKVLAPEEYHGYTTLEQARYWVNSAMMDWQWGVNTDSRKMTLEEKVGALAKALHISFEWTPEQERELVAKVAVKRGRPRKGKA